MSESIRLHASLSKENVTVRRLIVNQILPPSASDCKFCSMKRKVYPTLLLVHNKCFSFLVLSEISDALLALCFFGGRGGKSLKEE